MQTQFETIGNRIADFLPGLVGALLILFVGWLIARGIKAIVVKLLSKTNWDEKVFKGGNVKDSNGFIEVV